MCNGVDLRLGVAGAGRRAAKEAPEVSMCHIEEHRGFAALQPRPPRRESRVFATFAEGTAKTSPVGFTSNGVDLRLGVAGAGRSAAKEAPEVSMCHIEEHRGFAALQPRPPREMLCAKLKSTPFGTRPLGSNLGQPNYSGTTCGSAPASSNNAAGLILNCNIFAVGRPLSPPLRCMVMRPIFRLPARVTTISPSP